MHSNLKFIEMPNEYLPVFKAGLFSYHSAQLQQALSLPIETAHGITQRQMQIIDDIDRQGKNNQYLVSAKYNGHIVGGAWYSAAPQESAVLFWVFIEEKYQKQGFGKKLMQHVINSCRTMGASGFALHVFTKNETAIKLYRDFGLHEVGKEMYLGWSASGD